MDCGKCLTTGAKSPRDCNNECFGTHVMVNGICTVRPKVGETFCDGQTSSDAEINQCGFCVGGNTDRPSDFGLDKCGVCGGSDACLGCDGEPNSGATWDECKRCLMPNAPEFNQDCIRIGKPTNMIISSEKTQNVGFKTAGLLNTTVKSCNFTNRDSNFSALTSWFKQNNDELEIFAQTPSNLKSGNYSLQCTFIGAGITFEITSTDQLIVFDYSKGIKFNSAIPDQMMVTSETVKIYISGIFPFLLTSGPYCLNNNVGDHLQAEILNNSMASCTLNGIQKSQDLQLKVVPNPSMDEEISQQVSPVSIRVDAQMPKALLAQFSDDLWGIFVEFDVNVNGSSNCNEFFADVSNFGSEPKCEFSANKLFVTFGSNPKLNPGDQIIVEGSKITQPDAKYPSFLEKTELTVQNPNQPAKPIFSLTGQKNFQECQTNGSDPQKVQPKVHFSSRNHGNHLLKLTQIIKINGEEIDRSSAEIEPETEINLPLQFCSVSSTDCVLTFEACNFVDACSEFVDFSFKIVSVPELFSVKILGVPQEKFLPNLPLILTANAKLSKCGVEVPLPSDLKFSWDLISSETGIGMKKNSKRLQIRGGVFAEGEIVTVTLTGTGTSASGTLTSGTLTSGISGTSGTSGISGTSGTSEGDQLITDSDSINIPVAILPLQATIDPQRLKIGTNRPINLVVTSTSTSTSTGSLKHEWSCKDVSAFSKNSLEIADFPILAKNSTDCKIAKDGNFFSLDEISETQQNILNLEAGKFPPGNFLFVDRIEKNDEILEIFSSVQIFPGNLPKVQMINLNKMDPKAPLQLQAKLFGGGNEKVRIGFDFVDADGFQSLILPKFLQNFTKKLVNLTDKAYYYRLTLMPQDVK